MKFLKKTLVFSALILIIGILLCLLKVTGMPAHIALAVAGLVLLVAHTVMTKKQWQVPALEILTRVCYGIALITGVVLMKVSGVAALAVVHKIGAAAFGVLFIVLFVLKLRSKAK